MDQPVNVNYEMRVKLDIPAHPDALHIFGKAMQDYAETMEEEQGASVGGTMVDFEKAVAAGAAKVEPETEAPVAAPTPAGDPNDVVQVPTAEPAPAPAQPVTLPGSEAPAAPAATEQHELDAEGYPWDKRIHTASKSQYKSGEKKGRWKRARTADDTLWNACRAEVVPQAAAPAAAPAEPAQPAAPAPVQPAAEPAAAPAPVTSMPGAAAPAAAPAQPVAAPAQPAQPAANPAEQATFPVMITAMHRAINEKKITEQGLQQLLAQNGVPDYATNPAAITALKGNQQGIDNVCQAIWALG